MIEKIEKLKHIFDNAGQLYTLNEPLAKYTTWKIGGPADILAIVTSKEQLIQTISTAKELDLPYTILGGGSNVLIADEGIRGLVIINKIEYLNIDHKSINSNESSSSTIKLTARLDQIDTDKYYSFSELDYDESREESVSIEVGSGYYLPKLINILIQNGITGLQWFAGIPGTIGGAIYNNIHGGSHFISEYVISVETLTKENKIKEYFYQELEFDYDFSRFHHSNDTILSIKLKLFKGDTKRAQQTAIYWAQKKRLQPYKSAGCCFKNVPAQLVASKNLASSSWGYIIDKVLGLKETRVGDAIISPYHAAFIENLGNATADNVLKLFDLIYQKAKEIIGITPEPEIFFLGFSEEVTNKYSTSYSKQPRPK